ncbi:MAG TPA: RNA-guided pseudouridylation complex pseudouridine synthase subunit Cbf5 [Methanomicrobiales archaeon]|nr:RNA-guided pseudouridylation complex pseudouridine synthase subunit Cbf5 [Methanomicrobiales archaeon]
MTAPGLPVRPGIVVQRGPIPPGRSRLPAGPGIVVIDKPRGPSSHQVTAWAGKILGVPVGHAGTLDPGVSGVLVVMLGPAVRLAPFLQRGEKEYVCLWRLHGDVTRGRIEEVARDFEGRIYQRPPKKAAVKRALRIRTIHRLEVLEVDGRSVLIRVACDAGTYIRSLCHHMGLAAGPGGSMRELRRTKSGSFTEADAHTLQELEDAAYAAREGNPAPLQGMILPVGRAVGDLPRVTIRDTAVDAVCHGASLAGAGVVAVEGSFSTKDPVGIFTQKGELVAVAQALAESGKLVPGGAGLVAEPRVVLMEPGTYPRGWRKRKEKAEKR